jgi:hypothetical protein
VGVLADKLYGCRPRARCGSLACPKCARAFQRAKTSAQQALIPVLPKANSTKKLVMANVVPLGMTYQPHQLRHLDIQKRNRWLKDILTRAGFARVMFGSADISWEHGFYQLHWHIGMFTFNRKILTKRLKKIFPGTDKKSYDRPVVVSKAWSLGFLPYKDKGIKLPNLLRHNWQTEKPRRQGLRRASNFAPSGPVPWMTPTWQKSDSSQKRGRCARSTWNFHISFRGKETSCKSG